MNKSQIVKLFNLKKIEVEKIDFFITSIVSYNLHTNLVGKSTIENFWDRHVLDCLQLTNYIKNKKLKIIDLGTGAGLPGVLLSIMGYQNVLMIDSVKKKSDFVKKITKDLSLSAKMQNKRIEKRPTSQHDIIVSRALAPLIKLLTYARMYSNKNTTSFFLKGRSVNNEIEKAMRGFFFDFKKIKSISSEDGCVLQIKNIVVKNA